MNIDHLNEINRRLAGGWLLLALSAIGLSAMFALLLVISRTPGLQQLFADRSFFYSALVLHVNFSVVIWLFAFTGMLWSLLLRRSHPRRDGASLLLSATGTLMMAASPLFGDALPVMNNYVPVLAHPLFLGGLAVFTLGLAMIAVRVMQESMADWKDSSIAQKGLRLAALSFLTALLVIAITAWRLPVLGQTAWYEALFWGGGHVLQFVHTLTLMSAWLWLMVDTTRPHHRHPVRYLFLFVGLPVSLGLVFALVFDPMGAVYRAAFTQQMRWGGLLVLLPMVLWMLQRIHRGGQWRNFPLLLSVLLLMLGIVIGLLIRNDTVIVTAHYHATNAAVTLALMGLAYRLLPLLGLMTPRSLWIRMQAAMYAAGMGLYILGMAWSGWHGVPRKTAETLAENHAATTHAAMAMMGLGGVVAIGATVFFLGIVVRQWSVRAASGLQQGVGELK